jgi:hypothetical protein
MILLDSDRSIATASGHTPVMASLESPKVSIREPSEVPNFKERADCGGDATNSGKYDPFCELRVL